MLEIINQQIDVLVAFTRQKVMPLSFHWGNRKYCINQVNMVHADMIGRGKWYHFSVSSNDDHFQLGFDTENNKWVLEQVLCA